MKRREFIFAFGGAFAAHPLAARAQQANKLRLIGVLMPTTADDPLSKARLTAFVQGLQDLGWVDGRDARIDVRWTGGSAEHAHLLAAELVASAPDVIVTAGASHVMAIQQASRSVAIVFLSVTDPIGSGLVASMAHPGGNATGFLLAEFGTSAKWLELLKELSPQITRAAIIFDPSNPTGTGQFGSIESVASSVGVVLTPVDVRDAGELERGVAEFAQTPNGGLIVPANPLATAKRDLIVSLSAQHRLPAIYSNRLFVESGGLMSYGPDTIDQFRRAAGYVNRILKGEKPADLPVQAPTKYDLAINRKTAGALGLKIPQSLAVSADVVIE